MSQLRKLLRRKKTRDIYLKVFCVLCGKQSTAPLLERGGFDTDKLKQSNWRLCMAPDDATTAALVCPDCEIPAGEFVPDRAKRLRVNCVECGLVTDAPMNDRLGISTEQFAQKHGWFLSVITPPGHGLAVLGPVCPGCAPKVYKPELLAAAKKHFRADS
jgi:hypothetical protein